MTKQHFIALADAIKLHNRNFPTDAFNDVQLGTLAFYPRAPAGSDERSKQQERTETMYIIKRTDRQSRRCYVANPGSKHSYTANIHIARTFKTREEAESNRCVENEIVLTKPLTP